MFVMFMPLEADSKAAMVELSIVCDFLDVFLEDICDLPPKREVEFSIELVLGNGSL